jgi:hypothetical protein
MRPQPARIRLKDTRDASIESVIEILSTGAYLEPRVVDIVSRYYARRPAVLAALDAPSRRLILTSLAGGHVPAAPPVTDERQQGSSPPPPEAPPACGGRAAPRVLTRARATPSP